MEIIAALEVYRAGQNKIGRVRYPVELKRAAAAHLEREVRQGRSRASISTELGIHINTLDSWCARGRPTVAKFQPVQVLAAPSVTKRTLTVRGPRGLVVEGVSVAEVAALWRALE